VSSAAAEAATSYQQTFPGRADQVALVRRDIASYLAGQPAVDDAVLAASELAANSVLHSASAGAYFTVRCQASPGRVRIEVEDLGGPWQPGRPDSRPHGLDIIRALTGPGGWGTDTTAQGNRIVWAQLDSPEGLLFGVFALELPLGG
jgi:anti-sigma regulatory factor (Ser/Thr protein kinase)